MGPGDGKITGEGLDKKTLSEADICAKFITPALERAGWSEIEQIYREYTLRPGRVVVRGRSSTRDKKSALRADYALFYKTGIALACRRRLNVEPPCRPNIEPGVEADF
jgi:type I restriction enzyme R subunit